MQLQGQRLDMQMDADRSTNLTHEAAPLSRAQRAHYRLDWHERSSRNARAPTASRVTIKLFGVPEDVAASLGLATA
jgi:hypothetical protein